MVTRWGYHGTSANSCLKAHRDGIFSGGRPPSSSAISLLVIFSLFERLIDITAKAQKQGRPLKEVNCVMAFDEPEIHLHPFAQRALVKDLLNIAAGKDEGFNKVIKELLGIETFTAQLLIVSHSDRIIVGGYENIVRIYSQEREIKAISGHTIKTINAGQLKKYVEEHFINVKD